VAQTLGLLRRTIREIEDEVEKARERQQAAEQSGDE
jgi:hypothetical protein